VVKKKALDYAAQKNDGKNNPIYPVILSNFIELKMVKIILRRMLRPVR
jgi:hypothetical protein